MNRCPQLYAEIRIPNLRNLRSSNTECTETVKQLSDHSIHGILTVINDIEKETLRELLEVVAPGLDFFSRSNDVPFVRNMSKEKLLYYIAHECCATIGMRQELYRQYEEIQEIRRFIRFRTLG